MGSYANCEEACFSIGKLDMDDAFEALEEFYSNREMPWYYCGDKATNLVEWFDRAGWELVLEDDGVVLINITSDKYDDGCEDYFNCIAPFVTKDSFIYMIHEDGSHFRFYFNGSTCVKQDAIISWPTI